MQERNLNILEQPSGEISKVIDYFASKEINGSKLQTREALGQRLQELASGKTVPVVVFNCIFFNYSEDPNGRYPRYTAVDDTSKPISTFYADDIIASLDALKIIGTPKPYIVVPDSELLDERVFPFTQSQEEREALITHIKAELQASVTIPPEYRLEIITWSEYCQRYWLQSPSVYTEEALTRDVDTRVGAVSRQVQDSFQYFLGRGIKFDSLIRIPDEEFESRIRWYLAMYAGEGRALQDSSAIVLNFEDLRVRKWLRIGSDSQLPVLTPIPTLAEYKKWQSLV